MSGASSIHMNIFGLNPVVVFGTDEQKRRMLPPLARGEEQVLLRRHRAEHRAQHHAAEDARRAATATVMSSMARKYGSLPPKSADKMLLLARTTPLEEVRKPTHGLSLFYTDLDRTRVEVREIEKMGRKAVDSNQAVLRRLRDPGRGPHRRGGQGLRVHPARHEPRAYPDRRRGGGPRPGRARKAADYAKEREVFDRPIGKNQAIQHPLAECWMNLEAANMMML